MNTTTPETPACPNPHLYAYTAHKRDRRTKSGWRHYGEWQMEFANEADAAQYAVQEQDSTGHLIEYRKVWVLKQNFMHGQPGVPKYYWEEWNTPYCCSPSSELYWTM